ncbi:MAG: PHP domain-containing protein, partial [Hyphomicrobium sp.]
MTAANRRFVHLKVHSAYSLLEGALLIGKLAKLAAKLDFPAVGLTDTNNLYGALEFSDKLADAGIQPIVGVTLTVDFEDRRNDATERGVPAVRQPGDGNIALLAMNDAGYANLMKLVSRAHLDAADVEAAHTTADVVAAHADGLIALTGGPDGPIDRALRDSQAALAEARLSRLKAMFGDRLYVELQRHGLKSEHDVEPQLLKLAYANQLPI